LVSNLLTQSHVPDRIHPRRGQSLKSNATKRIAANSRQDRAFGGSPFCGKQQRQKAVGREAFRLRVGDWRVIYEIEGGRLVILVLTVAQRGGVYQ
jgi:mRNA interferase RelE/StbE